MIHVSLHLYRCLDPPSSESSPLSLHDALPIFARRALGALPAGAAARVPRQRARARGVLALQGRDLAAHLDRKSTRLNSSHLGISYAVFCLKKNRSSYAGKASTTCDPQ